LPRISSIKADRRRDATNVSIHRLLEIKHKLLLGHEWILERLTNSVDRGNSHFAT